MRLSEAIRLGALLKPQCFNGLFRGVGSCALGAALDAVGGTLDIGFKYRLELFEGAVAIGRVATPCSDCLVSQAPLDAVIVHLNDHHHWSRERIADWVETLELAQAGDAVAGTVDEHEPSIRATTSSSLSLVSSS